MRSLLIYASGLVTLAVGTFLIVARRAQWVAWLPQSEPPQAPRNLPVQRKRHKGEAPPLNLRTRPRDDRGALKRYATVARERRGYAALATATAVSMMLVLGGCGFLPPIADTTRIETPTVSGVNAVTEVNRYGGVVNSTRVTVPPSSVRDCANFLDEALPAPTAAAHPQTTMYMSMWRFQARLMCLRQGAGGMGMGMMGSNMLGMRPFPGGLRYKSGGER